MSQVSMIDFYLGTHRPYWLSRCEVKLFVSNRTLRVLKRLPRAKSPWALDSGGFSELSLFGRWLTSPRRYVQDVRVYASLIGLLEWASIQDWMCEPAILKKTGLTVEHHQLLTLWNYLELRSLAPEIQWVPVIQGWTRDQYLWHADMYESAGVDLQKLPRVGLGSICRRQATEMARRLVVTLEVGRGYAIHGFGMKKQAIDNLGGLLTSADSMAWSFNARYNDPLPTCTHNKCNNCFDYAMQWRAQLLNHAA